MKILWFIIGSRYEWLLSSIFAWDLLGKMERRKEDLCGQILDEFQVSFLKILDFVQHMVRKL